MHEHVNQPILLNYDFIQSMMMRIKLILGPYWHAWPLANDMMVDHLANIK